MWKRKIFFGFGFAVFFSLLSLWSGVFTLSASALSLVPNVVYNNGYPGDASQSYILTPNTALTNANFSSKVTFSFPNVSDTIYFNFTDLAVSSCSSSLFVNGWSRSVSLTPDSSYTSTLPMADAFPRSAIYIDSDSTAQSCHGYIDLSSVHAPIINLAPWSYGVTFTSSSTFSFSYSDDCPDCPDCPEIPANPYDDKLDNIYHAILLVGASFVVLMFLYQILKYTV